MTPKQIAAFAVGPIGAAAISFITLPFIAWFFSAEDIGRLTMLQVSLGLSTALFSLQMHQAYVREYHEVENKGILFKEAIFPGFILLLLVIVVALALPLSISGLIFGVESKCIGTLFILALFFDFFINFQTHVVRMQERGWLYSLSQIIPKVSFILFIGIVVAIGMQNSFENLMLMQFLSMSLLFVIIFVFTRRTYIEAFKSKVSWQSISRMLRFSLPLVAGGIAYWGLTALDRLMLRKYASFDELGVYSIALSIAGAAAIFSSIFSNIWHPMVYKWVKAEVDPQRIINANSFILLLISLIWCGFGLFSWIFTYFLPVNYLAVKYLIVGCIAAPLLYMLSETTVVGIGITRRSAFAMLASILAFIVGLISNLTLTPAIGAKGAAISTMIAFTAFLIVRTESSCFLWFQLPRLKLYLIVLFLIMASLTMILYEPKVLVSFLGWGGLLMLLILIQWNTLILSVKKLHKMIFLKEGWSNEL